MSSIDRKNVVLLGLGRAGKFHIQSIQAIPGLRLKCVVDVDEASQALGRRTGMRLRNGR